MSVIDSSLEHEQRYRRCTRDKHCLRYLSRLTRRYHVLCEDIRALTMGLGSLVSVCDF